MNKLYAAAAAAVLVVSACGSDDDSAEAPPVTEAHTTHTTTQTTEEPHTNGAAVAVSDAWARSSPRRADVGAMYFTMQSEVDDRLVEVRVPAEVAARTEIHETSMDGEGMMSMREIGEIELPAGTEVVLEPGGLHIMLMELTEPLSVGDTFVATLVFEQSDELDIDVEIRETPEGAGGGMGHGPGSGGHGGGMGGADDSAADPMDGGHAVSPDGDLSVDGAWARSSPRMAEMGAMYATLRSEVDDRLVEVRVPAEVAGRTEIHETSMDDDGMMSMREIGEIELPAGTEVVLEPGGLHIMLMMLTEPLTPGDTFVATLVFEHAGEIDVEVMIRES